MVPNYSRTLVPLDICPGTNITEKECKNQGKFFCEESKSCIENAKLCDGVIHCLDGADENFEICHHTFPESATIKCLEKNRNNYHIEILATPCNNVAECENDEDEQCDKNSIANIIVSVVLCIFTLLTTYSINHLTYRDIKVSEKDVKQNMDECLEPKLVSRIYQRVKVKDCVSIFYSCKLSHTHHVLLEFCGFGI